MQRRTHLFSYHFLIIIILLQRLLLNAANVNHMCNSECVVLAGASYYIFAMLCIETFFNEFKINNRVL